MEVKETSEQKLQRIMNFIVDEILDSADEIAIQEYIDNCSMPDKTADRIRLMIDIIA